MTKVYPVSEKQMVEKPPAKIALTVFLWYHLIVNLTNQKNFYQKRGLLTHILLPQITTVILTRNFPHM